MTKGISPEQSRSHVWAVSEYSDLNYGQQGKTWLYALWQTRHWSHRDDQWSTWFVTCIVKTGLFYPKPWISFLLANSQEDVILLAFGRMFTEHGIVWRLVIMPHPKMAQKTQSGDWHVNRRMARLLLSLFVVILLLSANRRMCECTHTCTC